MLLEALVAKQDELDLSDEQFAARLGISRQMWQTIRTGVSSMGDTTLANVTVAFPELQLEVLHFLRENAKVTRNPDNSIGGPRRDKRGRRPKDFTHVRPVERESVEAAG